MKNDQIENLADESANEAIRYIQEKMNISTGDFAGLYFSGDSWGELTLILSDYIRAEIQFKNGANK
jgi:hypothetical protein